MSTDDETEEDAAFHTLRVQLQALPRRSAPPAFEAELSRRLARLSSPPLVRVRWMRPLPAALSGLGALVLVLFFLVSDSRSPDPARPAVERSTAVPIERQAVTGSAHPPAEGQARPASGAASPSDSLRNRPRASKQR